MSTATSQAIPPAALREEFFELIHRDLLGPAGGEQEIITEQSVRNRYLLGMLAPRQVAEVEEEPFDELADDSEDNPEEGTATPSTPTKRGVVPSTFGLSFCLDLGETAFEVEAQWGQYMRDTDAEGKPVWKRYPRGGSRTISLNQGNLPPWAPDSESREVTVRGRVRRRPDHWSVTLFLSNEQTEGSPRDMYWLFQAELIVRGRFARRPGQMHVSTLDAVSRLEDRTNEMLYRRELEFARGHGISVEWELAEGQVDHATEIRTGGCARHSANR